MGGQPPAKRLPVQHKKYPHCPSCSRDLPDLNSMHFSLSEEDLRNCKVLQISVRVACPCGRHWDLTKTVSNG